MEVARSNDGDRKKTVDRLSVEEGQCSDLSMLEMVRCMTETVGMFVLEGCWVQAHRLVATLRND